MCINDARTTIQTLSVGFFHHGTPVDDDGSPGGNKRDETNMKK